jgi:CRISPR-associated protein Csc2
MRDPETGQPSTSIGTDEYIKPESIFLDIETVRDVTAAEFRYVLGNILRSSRYGAVSSRIGKVKNVLIGVIFSNCELFSNLELTQATYDQLRNGKAELDFPLNLNLVIDAVTPVVDTLARQVVGQLTILPPGEVANLVEEITDLYNEPEQIRKELQKATDMYGPQG